MTPPASPPSFPEGLRWYCIRTKRFAERAAAAAIAEELSADVFCPMIRFERARRTGKAWVTEALFPNYLFARFDFVQAYRRVQTTRGVLRIVGFGGNPQPVPDMVLSELRSAVTEKETIILKPAINPGDEIEVVAGPFKGLRTIVTRLLPARQRVAILLEILGTEREVEIDAAHVLPDQPHPLVGKS